MRRLVGPIFLGDPFGLDGGDAMDALCDMRLEASIARRASSASGARGSTSLR